MNGVNELIKDVSDIDKRQALRADKFVFEIEIENLHFKCFHLDARLIFSDLFCSESCPVCQRDEATSHYNFISNSSVALRIIT